MAEPPSKQFGFDEALPIIVATGGGTGSEKINTLVADVVPHLSGLCQIFHLTGRERSDEAAKRAAALFPFYRVVRFLTDDMKHAYAAADIVIARGGFGTLSELAALKKAAILIPKSGHQEENVLVLSRAGAVLVLHEETANGYHLARLVKELLANVVLRQKMGEKLRQLLPPAKPETILDIIRYLTNAKH